LLLMPDSAMSSSVLGDIYAEKFQSNGFPIDLALPALVTAASVLVPKALPPPNQSFIIPGDDALVNLFTALIAPVHCGKSSVADWAAQAMHIYRKDDVGEHFVEGKFGSAEQMLKFLSKYVDRFHDAVLVNPDEWSHLFEKAAIANASFPTVLTSAYYRRRQVVTVQKKDIVLNVALSFIGGIVEANFDMVFGASSLGGVYDRFLFGRAPDGFMWDYRPYPYDILIDSPYKPVPVKPDGSVFEVKRTGTGKTNHSGASLRSVRVSRQSTPRSTVIVFSTGKTSRSCTDWQSTKLQFVTSSRRTPESIPTRNFLTQLSTG